MLSVYSYFHMLMTRWCWCLGPILLLSPVETLIMRSSKYFLELYQTELYKHKNSRLDIRYISMSVKVQRKILLRSPSPRHLCSRLSKILNHSLICTFNLIYSSLHVFYTFVYILLCHLLKILFCRMKHLKLGRKTQFSLEISTKLSLPPRVAHSGIKLRALYL